MFGFFDPPDGFDSIEEFTDAFSVDLDLIIINDNLYSQDYELMIPFGYIPYIIT